MGIMEILIMITVIAASAGTAALLLWARTGFIVSSKPVDTPAPEATREEELLRQIDQIYDELPAEFWQRFHELVAERDAETLIPDGLEHQELIRMTDELEEWNARRVGLLLELARLRKTSIDEVMREFRHRAVAHG
jgi:hypothetical protein